MNMNAEVLDVVAWSAASMGGTLNVTLCAEPARRIEATEAARHAAQRVEAWAARLTRFTTTSDLAALNAATVDAVGVRPTLAAVLGWAHVAAERSNGVVDATLLDARLSAEAGAWAAGKSRAEWLIQPCGRTGTVQRAPGVRFDLDGVAKGWIADRAAELLIEWPSASVDADGDVSLRLGRGQEWWIDVADPRDSGTSDAAPLATLKLLGGESWTRSFGVATSGTTVHRWRFVDGRETHHLIDPRTGCPAETDVIQATVVAPTAREAEMLAKTAVILGSEAALPFLTRSAARTAILLLDSGDLMATPEVEKWLA